MSINNYQTMKLQKTLRHTIQKLREQKRKLERKISKINDDIRQLLESLNKIEGE